MCSLHNCTAGDSGGQKTAVVTEDADWTDRLVSCVRECVCMSPVVPCPRRR